MQLLRKICYHLSKRLYVYYQDGIGYKSLKKRHHLKKLDIIYSRYQLFDKKWLLQSKINTIIDIGANIGEFTLIFAELFPEAEIYAFEPLPDCYNQLETKTKHIPTISTFNIALGSKKSIQNIHKSSWHPASSFREMSTMHKRNYPHSADHKEIEVTINTLDSILQLDSLNKNILIKMDVQGFEDEVIKGGVSIFKQAKVIIVEVSFIELYKEEPLFHGIYLLLTSMGFEYKGSLKQSTDSNDESFLQADCIFINNSFFRNG
jgi:FkbM family methyltransferase